MNLKISFSILFAIFITFASFYLLNENISNPNSKENMMIFFEQTSENKNKIFLMGSSFVGEMNSTHVHKKISAKYPDFEVYNISYNKDNPSTRIQFLEDIIKLKPSIIFYGISYGDLHIPKNIEKEKPLPSIKQIFHLFIDNDDDLESINPKLTTLLTLRNEFKSLNLFPNSEIFYLPYTPFIRFQSYHTIIDTDIHYSSTARPFSNLHIDNFNQIIKTLEEENIPTVIFTPPHHKSYLETIPISQKISLKSLISENTEKFDLNFYNFTYKYQNLPIWRNQAHVAYNVESIIYSDDIGSMIISELEK